MKSFLIHLLTILCTTAVAQENAYERTYSTKDGLISNVVYDIEQDNDGYMWMATEGGLNKFNGSSFTNSASAEGLAHNEIVSFNKDCDGRIWLNSIGPLSYIEDGDFRTVDLPIQQNINMNFRAICHDSILWHVSGLQVAALSHDLTEAREVPPELQDELLYVKILNVYDDSLWVAVGSHIYILKDGEVHDSIVLSANLDRSYSMPLIHLYNPPYFYYFTDGRLYQYDRSKKDNVLFDDAIPTIAYAYHKQDILQLYLKEGGYISYRIDENSQLEYVEHVPDDKITTKVIQDIEGNSWHSYYNAGVSFIPKPNPNIIHYTADNFPFLKSIESLLWTNEGLWIGTANAQVIRYRDEDWKILDLPDSNAFGITRVNDIKQIDSESLLISSDVGLYLLRDDVMTLLLWLAIKKISVTDSYVIVNTHSSVLRISNDCIAEMALATQLNPKKKLSEKYPCIERLLAGRSYSSAINAHDQILIGSLAKGLLRIDHSGEYDYQDYADLLNVNINKINVLHDSTFLVGTKGRGLLVIDDEQIRVIDMTAGLSSGIINDIIVDGRTVYLATNKGLNIIKDITAEKLVIEILTEVNGLLTDQIKAIELSDGLLYIASIRGLSFLNVSSVTEVNDEARIVIHNVIVNAQELDIKDVLHLASDQNNIVIQFANLNYSHADDTNYAYRLRGIDDEWRVTQSREVSYNNLKPKLYTFEVTWADGQLHDSSQIKSITFDIEVPFLQSNLAKFLSAVLAIMLIYLLFYALTSRRNVNVLESKVLERTRSLHLKVDEINKINRQLERSNQELQDYAYATSHDLKSPLRTISSFVVLLKRRNEGTFTEKDNEYVNFIVKGVERMSQVVQDLLDLSKVSINSPAQNIDSEVILNEVLDDLRYQITEKKVVIHRKGDFPSLLIEPTKLKQLFQNLLTNAIKYNEDNSPQIIIEANRDERYHIFTISDNGIGIDEQYRETIFDIFKRLHASDTYEGTGIGLAICRKIMDNFNGTITCEPSTLGGSSFRIKLPF